jgi:prephenate dehydrogenase
LSDEILGVDNDPKNAEQALKLGLVDRIVPLDEAVEEADLIVLAIPVGALPMMSIKILNKIHPDQTVMDMGSTKQELCEVIAMHPNRGRFVATHPMWGTEHSGPEAAVRGAFAGRTVVVAEARRSDADARQTVEGLYARIGMPVRYMEAEEHDTHTAYISHISHITSFALALTVLEKERETSHIFDLAGAGFESTVRLAKSSPATWLPIFMQNKYNVLDVLREHIHQLQVFRKLLERDDRQGLTAMMEKANSIKKILE